MYDGKTLLPVGFIVLLDSRNIPAPG